MHISIIIPVYNHTKELLRCMESLKCQTFQNFEVIVVDDGSTDAPEAVMKETLKQFPQSLLIRQEHRGAGAARNRGTKETRAPFLLFCDADCILKPTALEKWFNALGNNPDNAFVYSPFYFGWKLMKGVPFDKETLRRLNYIHTTSLLRRKWFPGFDETLTKFQDWDLWLTILERGGEGMLLNEPLFTITPRRSGMSSWLPRVAYQLPWRRIGWMPHVLQRYFDARAIIQKKHQLPAV